jgi:hypothetical protein
MSRSSSCMAIVTILCSSSPRACSTLYEKISYNSKNHASALLPLGGIKQTDISDDDHVDCTCREMLERGMIEHIVGKVHVELEQSKRGLGADCVPPHAQVAVDVTYISVRAVLSLLDDSGHVVVKCVDEAALRGRTGSLNGQVPEPQRWVSLYWIRSRG